MITRRFRGKRKTPTVFNAVAGSNAADGTEVCKIAGLFLLNNLTNKFDRNSIGLYRDDGLAKFKSINGHHADKIR